MLLGGATRDAASWGGRSPPPLLGASSWDGGGAAGAPQWCRADHHVCPLSLHPVWLNWRVRVSGAKYICLDGCRQHSGASAETAERPTQAGVRLRIGLLALLPAPLLSLGAGLLFSHMERTVGSRLGKSKCTAGHYLLPHLAATDLHGWRRTWGGVPTVPDSEARLLKLHSQAAGDGLEGNASDDPDSSCIFACLAACPTHGLRQVAGHSPACHPVAWPKAAKPMPAARMPAPCAFEL